MAVELSILAAFGAMLSWGIGDFLIQRSVKKIGVVECLAAIGIIGGIGLLPFIWNDLNTIFLPENSSLLGLLGLLAFLAAILDFYALKIGKLSVIEFVLEIELPITVFLGILFFREVLAFEQWLIIGVAFIGILLISLESFNVKKHPFLEKGVLIAGASAILMGVINFLTASAARNISPLLAIWAPWTIIAIISILYLINQKKFPALWKNIQKNKGLVFWTGVMDTLAWLFFAVAVTGAALSITIAITESYVAVALYLGLFFNKEKIKKHQIAGAVLALGASILLGFW